MRRLGSDEHPDHAPVAGTLTRAPTLASVSVPTQVFNTALRAEQEPNNARSSESKGHAQVKVLEDGSIEFFLPLANPDQYYVNVHSTGFPGGAIRGQLR